MRTSQDRTGIYYWKCDRAAAFHGTEAIRPDNPRLETQLRQALERRFPASPLALTPADGQGNHRTYRLTAEETLNAQRSTRNAQGGDPSAFGAHGAFVRTEDGPERDNYFDVEAAVTSELLKRGIPVPRVLACDCSRTETHFAWQVLEYVPLPDLNHHHKQGALSLEQVAEPIGEAVARWQGIRPEGFGPFSASKAHTSGALIGLHTSYLSYFTLNLKRHVDFLTAQGFFTGIQAAAVLGTLARHQHLLGLAQGCLVHKDLALWNILGSPQGIAAFIDWDDAVSGDPMDDLSLLGCFYGAPVIERALAGYARVRPLPENHVQRFWLHLLRNMIVKAVIRVGAGYFKRSDSFFLIGSGSTGADLETFTRARIDTALRGLNDTCNLSIL
jgi:fructosamine-3-kinase